MSPELGKLAPPYPVGYCANDACRINFKHPLSDEWLPAFLYRDLESNKLVVFCEHCARYVELSHGERFKLVAL